MDFDRSTIGATADWLVVVVVVDVAGDVTGAESGADDCVVVDFVVTVRTGAGTGFAAATCILPVVERRCVDVVLVAVAPASDTLAALSAATGEASVVVGGVEVTAGGAVIVGGEPVSAGWVAWASKGVEESARAAAIAGRALVRALSKLVVIMHDQPMAAGKDLLIIVVPLGNGDESLAGIA